MGGKQKSEEGLAILQLTMKLPFCGQVLLTRATRPLVRTTSFGMLLVSYTDAPNNSSLLALEQLLFVPLTSHPLLFAQPTFSFNSIPPQEAITLNSKDRAPYMLQVEVVDCEDFFLSPLPPKLNAHWAHHKRSYSEGTYSPVVPAVDMEADDGNAPETPAVFSPGPTSAAPGTGAAATFSIADMPLAAADTTPVTPNDASLCVTAGAAAAEGEAPATPSATTDDGSSEAATETETSALLDPSATAKSQPATPARSASFTSRWFSWFRGRSSSGGVTANKDVKDAREKVIKEVAEEDAADASAAPATNESHQQQASSALDETLQADSAEASAAETVATVATDSQPAAERSANFAASRSSTIEEETQAPAAEDSQQHHAPRCALPSDDTSVTVVAGEPEAVALSAAVEPIPRSSPSEADRDAAMLLAAAAAGDNDAADTSSIGSMSVKDIRMRLTQASSTPESQFQRNQTDPTAVRAKEPWPAKEARIRRNSPYGHLRSWRLIPVIIKSGDDLRQELLATQLLALFQQVWQEERMNLWLRPMRVLVTSAQGGMIEVVGGAVSLHQTKKETGDTLPMYYQQQFGPPNSEGFLKARVWMDWKKGVLMYVVNMCFLFIYFFTTAQLCGEPCSIFAVLPLCPSQGPVRWEARVKFTLPFIWNAHLSSFFISSHNGNILIDNAGHILHIDFGFFLSNSPGRNFGFETAPFKLVDEFVQLMGGRGSDMFNYFELLFLKGFMAARKHADRFITLVTIMSRSMFIFLVEGRESGAARFGKKLYVFLCSLPNRFSRLRPAVLCGWSRGGDSI